METVPVDPAGKRRLRNASLLAFVCVLIAVALTPTGVQAAKMQPAPPPGSAWLFSLPAEADVSRGFDPPDQRWSAGHRGVDLVVGRGEQVHAAGAGTVVFAGVVVDRPLVSIEHPVGIRTTYEPVEPSVIAGAWVQRGDVIGVLHQGNGHCPSSCLHWGARTGPDEYIDPLRLLRPPAIRLYPPEQW